MKLVKRLCVVLLALGWVSLGIAAKKTDNRTPENSPDRQFLLITEVIPGSAAFQVGIRKGDILRAYNGNGVESEKELEAAKEMAIDSVEILVDRADETLSFIIPVGPIGVYLEERFPELTYASDVVVLDGIASLEGMNNSYIRSLSRVAAYLKDASDCTNLMGLSGAAFRLQFEPRWNPLSVVASEGYPCDLKALEALGYEYQYLLLDENFRNKEAMRQAIIESIDAGSPVLAFQLNELLAWGIITGYQKSGREFIVRTYGSKRDGYSLADSFPKQICLIEGRNVPPTMNQAIIRSFAIAQEVLDTPRVGEYYCGTRALESWIQSLETGKFYDITQDDFDRILTTNKVMYEHLIEDRNHAARYLEAVASEFPDIQDKLVGISKLYRTEADHLSLAFEEDSCIVGLGVLKSQYDWTSGMRISEINYLEFARVKEDEALKIWREVNAIYNPPAPEGEEIAPDTEEVIPEEVEKQPEEEMKEPKEEPVIIPRDAH